MEKRKICHKSSDEYESISFPASPVLVPVLNSLMMNDESGPLAADREFFAALLRGSVEDLNRVVADDFILIEVMGGSEITKSALLAAIQSSQLKFGPIEPTEVRVRVYQTTAVITGRNRNDWTIRRNTFRDKKSLQARVCRTAGAMAVGSGPRYADYRQLSFQSVRTIRQDQRAEVDDPFF